MGRFSDSIKREGAIFWDTNPCGGEWTHYRDFMTWIHHTETYIFQILDKYEWDTHLVLDLGCGQGTTLNYLPSRGAKVVGMDMSLHSILVARNGASELGHPNRTQFSVADAEDLPFVTSGFDDVLSIGVLHHTEDTERGIQEVFRLLKPGGRAIVMLYRSGNPKWWMVKLLRIINKTMELLAGQSSILLSYLRRNLENGSKSGTAILELFGVPILKAFSNKQTLDMFRDFRIVRITNHQPGFARLIDILPIPTFLAQVLIQLDMLSKQIWGFYQVIEATK